ncbi:MAG: hypothetical protein OXH23_16285 [bacterium]|nr:hypothetical protein [bacterium]
MNAVSITLIGVIGSGLISAFFVMIRMMASRFDRLEDKFEQFEDKVDGVVGEVHALEIRLTDKFTGELKNLEARLTDKFTGAFKAQGERIDRVYDVLRLHGERLARIEFKLDIDPPAEAA